MDAPDDFAKVLGHLGRGMSLMRARATDYEKARDYYLGRRAEVHANPTIAALLQRSAQAHPLALAHIPVDALLDRVDLTGVASSTAAKQLEAILDETGYLDEVDDWHTKAGYFGDYYVMLDPLDEDEETGVAGRVELVGASPLSSIVVYDQRTERRPIYGVRVWHEADETAGRWRATVFYDDCTVHLETGEGMTSGSQPKSSDFGPSLDDEGTEGSERVPHAGGVMLLEHFPVDGKPYGRPLHLKAYGPQDALTKLNATSLATVDGAGFPLRYALMHENAEVDDDDADDFDADFDASGSSSAARQPKLKTDPGSIQFLRGVKAAGTFEGAKPDAFLASQDWHVRAMAVATGTPIFEFDAAGEQPSGEARRRAESRIVRHAERVVRDLTAAHRRLVEKLLALRGVADAGDVTVTFAPLETSTDTEGIDLVGKKVAQGVPPRVALLEAGYTTDAVDEWFPEGDDAALSIDAVGKLAPALASLGQAVTLGVVTPDEARAMLPRFLTAARGEGPNLGALEEELARLTPPAAPAEA